MTMPFPGMDPYLEHPNLWPGVHNHLATRFLAQLQPLLEPRYIARLEHRVYLEETGEQRIPDLEIPTTAGGPLASQPAGDAPLVLELPEVEVTELSLNIVDTFRKVEIVTVIEVTSPANKRAGPGRDSYVRKQREVLASECHLVEIDLLRGGRHVLSIPETQLTPWQPFDYLVCINRWPKRNRYELYRLRVRDRLPLVRVPLGDSDPDVILDVRQALEQVYLEGAYRRLAAYEDPCEPPLAAEDQQWADDCLRAYRAANPRLFPVGAAKNGS